MKVRCPALILGAVGATILSAAAIAQTPTDAARMFDEGVAAYDRGDFAGALSSFRTLAEQGDAVGQYNLGFMYDSGKGLPENDTEALKWYRLAAEQGYASAQINLGLMYYHGDGVPQDYAEAENWYRRAAEQGVSEAQFNMGAIYANGDGVPRSYVDAYKWLTLAMAQQNAAAEELRDLLRDLMTADQIAEGERLAAEWKPLALLTAAAPQTPQHAGHFRDPFVSGAGYGPEMVALSSGSFMMGSPDSEQDRSVDEGPQRRVSLKAFAAGKYEVTWAEYEACVSAGGCLAAGDDGFGKGSRPVTNVSWDDARAYVAWLSARTGQPYRLLSEAEWEYAARAGRQTPWSTTGDGASLADYAWYTDNSGAGPQPVGAKTPNTFGLYDMHGNVWEWTEDCYAETYAQGQPSDGRAFSPDTCARRVNRGGSWSDFPELLRSAYRSGFFPAIRINLLGFRVARTL